MIISVYCDYFYNPCIFLGIPKKNHPCGSSREKAKELRSRGPSRTTSTSLLGPSRSSNWPRSSTPTIEFCCIFWGWKGSNITSLSSFEKIFLRKGLRFDGFQRVQLELPFDSPMQNASTSWKLGVWCLVQAVFQIRWFTSRNWSPQHVCSYANESLRQHWV